MINMQFERFFIYIVLVRSEVLMAASMKMTVFWVVAPCSLVEALIFQRCLLPPSACTSVSAADI
jgi:hypothetical protein